MKKLKSNDLHAPVQFISPYTQIECLDRIEQHFSNEDDGLVFMVIDDALTEFRITYQYGSRQYVALGTLRVWAAGEQTRVICQLEHEDTMTGLIPFFPFLGSPDSSQKAEGFKTLDSLFIIFVGFLLNLSLGIFTEQPSDKIILNSLLLCVGMFALFGAVNVFGRYFSQSSRWTRNFEHKFYDRLVALLSEPESA